MALIVKDTEGFKSAPTGTHAARCIKVIDLGTQHSTWGKDEDAKEIVKKQVLITWELPTELIEEGDLKGQPYAVSKFYTQSLNEKSNLRKDLESWRGLGFSEQELMGFNIEDLLGKPCLVTVVHNDKGKAKVSAVTSPPKGMTIPDAVNDFAMFSINEWDQTKFDNLTDGIKKIIKQSDEYKNLFGDSPPVDESDIPF